MLDSSRYTIGLAVLGFALIGGAFAIRHFFLEGDAMTVLREPVTQEFRVGESSELDISTFNGQVKVSAGGAGVVRVTVTRKGWGETEEEAFNDLGFVEVRMTQEANVVRVVARRAEGAPASKGSGAEVEVVAPAGASVEGHTTSGALGIEGIHGRVTARTSNGEIVIAGAEADVSAETSNGRVEVDSSLPVLVDARSMNGEVRFRGPLAEGPSAFVTSNGSVRLELPESSTFSLEASTSNGRISSDFPINGSRSRTRVSGESGTGAKTSIRAITTNGSVHITRR